MKLNNFLFKIDCKNSFLQVTSKINVYKKNNNDKKILSLGIGDVSFPICDTIIKKMHEAVDDLSSIDTFQGYGNYYGHDFLKKAILDNEYKDYNLSLDEIYISNGTKSDSSNILELFDINSKICITDVMYPVYKNGALALNRNVDILTSCEENNFIPEVPTNKYDIIYICSPNNPLGITYNYEELKKWVDYANKNKSIILYDNVYSTFVRSKNVPKSIYEIPGAKNVAIEFRSFSKRASFTGVRCSYYVIPNDIENDINKLWKNRTINRFNGVDYVAEVGACASFLPEAQETINKNINGYLNNSKLLKDTFINNGFKVWGGDDSPFMWVKTKNNMKSWDLFNLFLEKLNIIIIPGTIFGKEGYFRVSALGSHEDILQIIERINDFYEKNN